MCSVCILRTDYTIIRWGRLAYAYLAMHQGRIAEYPVHTVNLHISCRESIAFLPTEYSRVYQR